jgi:hypothetical protein
MHHPGMQQQLTLGSPYNNGIFEQGLLAIDHPGMQHSPVSSNGNIEQHVPMNTQKSEHKQNIAMQHPYFYANMPPTIAQQGTYQNTMMQRPSSQSNGTSMQPRDAQHGQHMQHPSMQRPAHEKYVANDFSTKCAHAEPNDTTPTPSQQKRLSKYGARCDYGHPCFKV